MNILEWKIQLPYSACDFTGCWKPSAILESMQEIAGSHSHVLHCGREIMMEKGIVWVLTRIEVQMNIYPLAEEEITIMTFPKKNRRWFLPRYFIFKNQKGEEIGKASTIWALLDVHSRKMVPPTEILHLLPDNNEVEAPMGLPAPTVLLKDEGMKRMEYAPLYGDLDVNEHVNNTKYMEWFCNGLGYDFFRENLLNSFCINYDAEIRPKEKITLELRREEDVYGLTGKGEEKKHFEITASSRKRKAAEYKK